jgi:hypothetical protein
MDPLLWFVLIMVTAWLLVEGVIGDPNDFDPDVWNDPWERDNWDSGHGENDDESSRNGD